MARRIVAVTVTLLVLVGAWLFHEGECATIRAEAAEKAVPMCLPVNLSRPGVYRGQYRKTFAANHSDYLRLEIQPAFESREELKQALTGLSARIVVTDEGGQQVQDSEIDIKTLEPSEGPTWNPGTIGLGTRGTATYNVEIHVIQAAQGMKEKTQCLVGRYLFCGMEFLPAMLMKAIGVGCWIVAGVIGFLAWAVRASRPPRSLPPST